MTNKIFHFWNKEKIKLNREKAKDFYVNSREIWFVKMGKNIGNEEDGKNNFLRPVLVIKKVGSLFFTIALTSKGKINNSFYHKFIEIELQNSKYQNSSYAVLSQAKVMDKRRFVENVGIISKKEFLYVKQKLKTLLF
jgi:mRNA-degrading endonuclease toxin of MazEF toxin-antitoxin module